MDSQWPILPLRRRRHPLKIVHPRAPDAHPGAPGTPVAPVKRSCAQGTSLPYLIFDAFFTRVAPCVRCPRGRTRTPRPGLSAAAPMVAPSTPGPPCPSKDSDARHHNRPFRRYEGRQDDRKRGRRLRLFVLVLVLALVAGVAYGAYWGVSTVRASFPQTTGTAQAPGPARPGRGQARRLRRPADLRRQRRGPVHGPGLRPGAGPLLRDGRPPPHDLGPALGDVRQRPGRHRRVPAHPGLAPGRAAGVRHQAVAGHEAVPPGVLGGGERVSQGQGRQGHLRRVRGARPHQRLQAAKPGRRSTRWPGSRRWPGTCAATCRTRSTAP